MKRTNILAGISGVLMCAAWLQPIYLPLWVAFHGEVLAFAALGMVFLALQAGSNSKAQVTFPEITLSILLVLIICQYLSGRISFIGDIAVYTLYIVGLVLAIVVGRSVGKEVEVMEYLAWCIVVSAVGSVFIALIQTFSLNDQYGFIVPISTWRRPGANLAQPNNLGTLLLWGQVSVLYLCLVSKLRKKLALILVGLLAIGIAITESRTALIGVIASSVWMYMSPALLQTRSRLLLSLLYLGISVGLFLVWPKFMGAYYEAEWGAQSVDARIINTQSGAREIVWAQLLDAVRMQPIFGWGLGGVSRALNGVIDQYDSSYPFTYAHNILFDLAIGVGIPVTGLFAIGWVVWFARRMSCSLPASQWFSFALLIPFALHSMTEFPFSYAYFLFPAGIAIGVIGRSQSEQLKISIPRFLYLGVYAIWCLLALLVLRDYLLAAEDFRVARMEARKIGHTSVNYTRPKLFVLDQLDAVNTVTRMTPAPNMSLNDMDLLNRTALKYPWTAMQSRYALALALNGDIVEAERQLVVMRTMHGQDVYASLVDYWKSLAVNEYPQLKAVPSLSKID